jgi:peptidoglycan/LPS O-acetylase OafA/YrhL
MPDVPPRKSSRYDALDMWRGVACVLVLINHSVFYKPELVRTAHLFASVDGVVAAIATRLWAGVPLFFVISGYCISATIDSHRRKNGGVGAYFFKRFRRIFPPYWATLAGAALLIGVGDLVLRGAIVSGGALRPWWFSGWQWAGSMTLTEIWRWHLIGGPKGLTLGPAWTLCYEEQFYAVTGLLLFVSPRRYFAGSALITIAVVAIAAAALRFGVDIDGFFFDGAWVQFALGILLFYVVNYTRDDRRAKLAATAVFSGVIAWSLSFGSQLLSPEKNAGQAFLVAAAFALAALWLHPLDAKITSNRLLKPLRTCGAMCYSLYLVQVPVIVVIRGLLVLGGVDLNSLSSFVSLPLCAIPTLWIAWQFHVAVERRFMTTTSAQPAQQIKLAAAV